MLIHFIFNPAQIFWITRKRYEYKYKSATIVSVLSIFFGQIIAIFVVLRAQSNQGVLKLWANEIGMLIFSVPIYFLILIQGKTFVNIGLWKKLLIFAIPLLPHYLAQHVMSGADRIMIGDMVSQADAGIYNVVSNIGMIATLIWNAINASLVPYTFEHLNKKEYKDINRTVETLVYIYGLACLLVVLIAPEVLYFLAPDEYSGGLYAVPPITFVSFLNALYNVYANIEFYDKRTGNITFATIVSAVINIGLNAVLIPRFSYIGAAYTTLISYLVLIAFHYYGYSKCSVGRVYNDKRIICFSLILLLFSLMCNFMYTYRIIRYIVLAVMAVFTIIKRKSIIGLIKRIRSN